MADELLPAAGPVKHNLNSPVELLLSLKQGTPAAEATESHQEDQASSPGSSTNPTIDEHHDSQSPTSDKHMTENARDNASSTASTSSGSETDLPSSSNESATKGNENDEEYIPPASRPVNASIGAKRPSALSKPVGRNNLPKDVTAKLKTWFFDHADHPYPNEEKKVSVSSLTGAISLTQSGGLWFVVELNLSHVVFPGACNCPCFIFP
jgi:cobalamin biosynthesis Mg chelatase CobN